MKILITGANGQLGKELKKAANQFSPNTYFFTNRASLNITDRSQIQEFVVDNKIDTIINCAAYTNVENAEDEFKLANEINHLAVKNLAEISKLKNIRLIHISTDYVFDGNNKKPYNENDITNPINNYGKTKLLGEEALVKTNPKNAIIIRTSWLYSSFNSNFVKTILLLGTTKEEINVIDNQIGSPTSASDLAETILKIVPKLQNSNVEIYHYSNKGQCSWYDFAKEIMVQSCSNCIVKPIHSKKYLTKAKRPNYSLMNTTKIQKKFQIDIPFWKESLKQTIANLNN